MHDEKLDRETYFALNYGYGQLVLKYLGRDEQGRPQGCLVNGGSVGGKVSLFPKVYGRMLDWMQPNRFYVLWGPVKQTSVHPEFMYATTELEGKKISRLFERSVLNEEWKGQQDYVLLTEIRKELREQFQGFLDDFNAEVEALAKLPKPLMDF